MTPTLIWTDKAQRDAAPQSFVDRMLRLDVDALEASVTFRRREMPPFDVAEIEVTIAAGENHLRRGIVIPGPLMSPEYIAKTFAWLTRMPR